MKELMAADFPRDEHLNRFQRTQVALREDGIDALFLTGRQSLRYFAGRDRAHAHGGEDFGIGRTGRLRAAARRHD